MASGTVTEITNFDQHESFIDHNPRTVIFFGSAACGHCQTITPVFNSLASQYPHIAFGHVETTKVKALNIRGVPVFVGYCNHQPVEIVLGADKQELKKMLDGKLCP